MSLPYRSPYPSPREVALLKLVAATVADVFEDRGFKVDRALEVDTAFGGRVRAAALRELAIDAASLAASQHGGLDFRNVAGGGREFRFFDGQVDRRYRLRLATVGSDGNYVVTANSESALTDQQDDGADGLFPAPIERWVLGLTFTPDNHARNVFAARIVDFEPGNPGRLVLGHALELMPNSPTLPPTGFESTDEDLDMGDEETGDEKGHEDTA